MNAANGLVSVHIQDLEVVPEGQPALIVPTVPDFDFSLDEIIESNSGLRRTVCLPGDEPICLDISITPSKLRSFRDTLDKQSAASTDEGDVRGQATTAFFYLGSDDISVSVGTATAAAKKASVLGWEVSCTVGVSGGK